MQNIRPPQVAGYFYPSDPVKLRNQINTLLDSSNPKQKFEKIFGIVSPHAGYIYSGKTAAFAYNQLRKKNYKRVVVISPSHSEYFPGISVFDGDAYETPLGVLDVDKEFADQIVNGSKTIFRGFDGHRKEHGLEVQLPFLQSVLSNFKIVPVVMGDQRKMFVDELSNALARSADNETLLVASSDLSHFHSKQEANLLDSVVEKCIREFDFDRLQKDLDRNNCEACGGGPILVVLKTASLRNINHSSVLHRSDSGDVTGDNDEVVGYLSAVVYQV